MGYLLIFDKQDMVVARPRALPRGDSEPWRCSLRLEGNSGTRHHPADPKATALPLNSTGHSCHLQKKSFSSPFLPFSVLQVITLLSPSFFWALVIAIISMPLLCLPHHSAILKMVYLIGGRGLSAIDLFLSNSFPSFLHFFCYFQLIIFARVQLQINSITDRFHISLNQQGHL